MRSLKRVQFLLHEQNLVCAVVDHFLFPEQALEDGFLFLDFVDLFPKPLLDFGLV